ncbi:HNH endonuclease [Caulobacter sp. RL271]|uniref:HNH endonuclease n=1 Tax=Caulobacter segnis TaxID=88688 RepID=A0ABY4ZTC3_9CAUL|nr:HNH endonuclease [Caulobacter segnis]USQ95884.1 HNH endonuclease [Caulobacter segnis]
MTNPKSPPGKTSASVIELSEILNRLGNQVRGSVGETFRNPAGVYMKMMNLRAHDPDVKSAGKVGLMSGGKGDELVWNEFAHQPELLRKVAAAIRIAVEQGALAGDRSDEDDDVMEAAEGRVLTRLHRYKERDRKLVDTKKARVLRSTGALVCEVCTFDFSKRYGPRGAGFIEAHHKKPVHTLPEDGKTREEDLALVCANCHRMIHASRPWLSLDELRAILVEGA